MIQITDIEVAIAVRISHRCQMIATIILTRYTQSTTQQTYGS
ncbi:hypothetical protein [Nostoc sp.]